MTYVLFERLVAQWFGKFAKIAARETRGGSDALASATVVFDLSAGDRRTWTLRHLRHALNEISLAGNDQESQIAPMAEVEVEIHASDSGRGAQIILDFLW